MGGGTSPACADAQVINLRTLKPLDRDTIVNSVRKTHRLVTAEEGWPQSGVGAELVALVNEEVVCPSHADRACLACPHRSYIASSCLSKAGGCYASMRRCGARTRPAALQADFPCGGWLLRCCSIFAPPCYGAN